MQPPCKTRGQVVMINRTRWLRFCITAFCHIDASICCEPNTCLVLHPCLFDVIKVQWMILQTYVGILIVHYPSGHAVLVFYLPLFWTCYPGALKLQKEREVAKAEKKDRKREKKEKKEKKREEKAAKKEKSNLGFDKATHESKGKYLFKCLEDEAEQLERSNLTEEHEPAVCSQNSSCSSDSTQNSNKRKRPASPACSGIQAHGSIIRIRLSKKGVPGEISASKEKQLPKPAQQIAEVNVRTSAERTHPLLKTTNLSCRPPVSVSEPSTSNSGRVDRVAVDTSTPSCSKVHENSIEFQYKNLIENWLPPSLQSDNNLDDDQSWLFQRKPKQARVEEKNVGSNDTAYGSCSLLWQPRAQYLPGADLYALPYTIPFWITLQLCV